MKNWKMIGPELRERSGSRCECEGECGRGHLTRCEARLGTNGGRLGWPVILTEALVSGQPRAFCSECHLALDAAGGVPALRQTKAPVRTGRAPRHGGRR